MSFVKRFRALPFFGASLLTRLSWSMAANGARKPSVFDGDSLRRTMGLNLDNLPVFSSGDAARINELLNDEEAFDVFFNDLEAVKNMKSVVQDMRAENEALALQVTQKKKSIDDLAADNTPLQEQYSKLRAELQKSELLYQQKIARFEPAKLIARLKQSVDESESQTAQVAESLFSGKITLEEFLHLYKDMRKLYHMRAAKLDKVTNNAYVFPVFPQVTNPSISDLESRLSSLLK